MCTSRSVRSAALWLLLGSLLAMPAAHAARAWKAGERVRIEVVDRDTGSTAQPVTYRGDTWIAGTPGAPYAIRLTNTTGSRVLVVLSVDGVNAISGETASPSQTGYVLAPWQTTEITGWRKSHDDVARFEFAALADSYAAQTGRPDNVGTIGIAVFGERAPPSPIASRAPAPAPQSRPADAARGRTAPAAEAVAAESAASDMRAERQRLGTGHGAREWAPVTSTAFERATRTPVQVTTLRYDSVDTLVARGVLPRHRAWAQAHRPDAFPGGFVPDP
ncbi:conserved exported hypothetical protein [Luteimonas sp. 9C]|uniref:hypothetical protein n=1 Tax=Luteimonas sp. 9C TaxID=2653148 RepID=UPI0012F1BC72|nr:hypothetical protein [Luteimonas sp. 9C]VXA92648.1 conserved exported hypothetical protein [Luteimonas sp. 9C]